MTIIPSAVLDYRARLVDTRKTAYVDAILAAHDLGQLWPMTDSKLPTQLAEQVRVKLQRYGLRETTAPAAKVKARVTTIEAVVTAPVTIDDTIVVCPDCKQAYRASEARLSNRWPCPNPACWSGMAAWHAAVAGWKQARDSYVGAFLTAEANNGATFNRGPIEESWCKRNPEPAPYDFEGGQRPRTREWESYHHVAWCRNHGKFTADCQRCEKARSAFYARMPKVEGAYSHGRFSVIAERFDKVSAEIAKVDAEKPRQAKFKVYGRGPVHTAPSGTGPGGLVTHTIGGEKWDAAAGRMWKDADSIDWTWRMQSQDVAIPCSARSYSDLTTFAGPEKSLEGTLEWSERQPKARAS